MLISSPRVCETCVYFKAKDPNRMTDGVDYLKYDNCYNQGQSGTAQISFDRYNVMSQALNATGRPIVYSLCNWGQDQPWDWVLPIDLANDSKGCFTKFLIGLHNLEC